MEIANKRKRNSRRTHPMLRSRPPILNDYSNDDTLPPSETQDFPNLMAHQEGWRQTRKNIVYATGDNDDAINASMHRHAHGSQPTDNRRKNMRTIVENELVDKIGAHQLQGSQLSPPNRIHNDPFLNRPPFDNRGQNLRNIMGNEFISEMGDHLQGMCTTPYNPIDNDQSSSHCEFSTETNAGNLGKSIRGRGAYKGLELDKLTDGRKNKIIVYIPPGKNFTPISKYRSKLSSWLGYCAKRFGPPKESWIEVERKYRSRLWSMVQDYFDVSLESPEKYKKREELGLEEPDSPEMKRAKFEHYCFSRMHNSYIKWKNKLYGKYKMYSSDEERLKHVPEELSVEAWKEMLKVFSSKEFQELSAINSENRKAQTCVTSTGPTPFAEVEYDLIDDEVGELPKASDVWMATHGISDDQGQKRFRDLESRRIYEEMQMIENQPINVDGHVPTPDEVFHRVSGVKSGHVRGKGLGYRASARGMRGMASACKDEVKELQNEVARLTSELKAQEEHRKVLEERDRERTEAQRQKEQLFAEYFKKVDMLMEQNSSMGTQNSSEEHLY